MNGRNRDRNVAKKNLRKRLLKKPRRDPRDKMSSLVKPSSSTIQHSSRMMMVLLMLKPTRKEKTKRRRRKKNLYIRMVKAPKLLMVPLKTVLLTPTSSSRKHNKKMRRSLTSTVELSLR